jgi:CRISPR-associated protein Cas1
MTNVLNTLYVTVEQAYVRLEGESLVVRVNHETRAQVPLHHLVAVVCFGGAGMSPEAMHACAEAGVAVAFLSHGGRFRARVEGPLGATATLRRAQYAAADDPQRCLALARGFVGGKIANSRLQLRRAARTREQETEAMSAAADRLRVLGERVLEATDLDVLRGIEGEAAARYFEVFDAMIGHGELRFEKRTRRPPKNEVNALLSFGYTLLTVDCLAAAQAVGLDPAVGYLHAERSGRPALALDLVEELRAIVVDRMVLAMLRLGQSKGDDFERMPTGEVRMKDGARKAFLVEYQKRKQDEVAHPQTGQQATWALMPHIQARLLARAIRGEGDYVPMLAK